MPDRLAASGEAWRALLAQCGAERLQGLALAARALVEGLFPGRHPSIFTGSSVEFLGHRAYAPGDDVRAIDWRLAARTDREYIRLRRAETDLEFWILLDVSRSMRFPPDTEAKAGAARLLAAAIAYLTLAQGDRVAVARFTAGLTDRLPPGAGPGHLRAVLAHIAAAAPLAARPTDLARALRALPVAAGRRSVAAVISDLLDEPERIFHALGALAARRFEIFLFHVIDPTERELPDVEAARLLDLETGATLSARPREIAAAYRRAFEAFADRIAALARARGIEHAVVRTDAPPAAALRGFLARREALVRRAGR